MCQTAGEAQLCQAGVVVHFLGWEHSLSPHPAWGGGVSRCPLVGCFLAPWGITDGGERDLGHGSADGRRQRVPRRADSWSRDQRESSERVPQSPEIGVVGMIYFNGVALESVAPVMVEDIRVSPISR